MSEDLSRKTILIIDNSLEEFAVMRSFLGLDRYNFIHSRSLHEALKEIDQQRFHVILCDLNLPDSCFLDTFEILSSRVVDIPIVALSSSPDDQLEVQIVQRGGQDFICKSEMTANSLSRSVEFAMLRHHILIKEHEVNLKLEAQSNYKSKFMTHFSHEIRTPLNAVLGCANLMEKTDLSTEQMVFLESIKDGGERILSLVSDILDLSKIEAGKFSLLPSIFDLNKLFESCIQLNFPKAHEKRLQLSFQMDSQVPKKIYADDKRIFQILTNLLSNAIKYTENGSVDVFLTLNDSGDLLFEISDTGRGIDVDKKDTLFKPFSQLDPRDMLTGTGMGLSICRELAYLQGGDIGVRDHEPKGSIFWFSIPLIDPPSEASKCHQEKVAKLSGGELNKRWHGKRILVVDDDKINRQVLSKMLSKYGIITVKAYNGLNALEVMSSEKPFDLIFMDCSMPELDGFETTKRIRISGVQTLIVALTAHAFEEQKNRCLKVGMDFFITKPICLEDIERLLSSVASLK